MFPGMIRPEDYQNLPNLNPLPAIQKKIEIANTRLTQVAKQTTWWNVVWAILYTTLTIGGIIGVLTMGAFYSMQDSMVASNMVVMTSHMSRDWNLPNSYSMHYQTMDEHSRLYLCMQQAGMSAPSAPLSDNFDKYRDGIQAAFIAKSRDCNAESDGSWPRDYGFLKCIQDVFSLTPIQTNKYLLCLDTAEGVMVASIQPPGSMLFMGSYNFVAFLLAGAAILVTFMVFTMGGWFWSNDVDINSKYHTVEGTFTPFGSGATNVALILSALWVFLACFYSWPTNTWSDVPAQDGRHAFPHTPWTGMVCLAGVLVNFLCFLGYFLQSYDMVGGDVESGAGNEAGAPLVDGNVSSVHDDQSLVPYGGGYDGAAGVFPSGFHGSVMRMPPIHSIPGPGGDGPGSFPGSGSVPSMPDMLIPGSSSVPEASVHDYSSFAGRRSASFPRQGAANLVSISPGMPSSLPSIMPPPGRGGLPYTQDGKIPSFILNPDSSRGLQARDLLLPRRVSSYDDRQGSRIDNDTLPKKRRLDPLKSIAGKARLFYPFQHHPFVYHHLSARFPGKSHTGVTPTELYGFFFQVTTLGFLLCDVFIFVGMITPQSSPLREGVIAVMTSVFFCRFAQFAASFFRSDNMIEESDQTETVKTIANYRDAGFISGQIASLCFGIDMFWQFNNSSASLAALSESHSGTPVYVIYVVFIALMVIMETIRHFLHLGQIITNLDTENFFFYLKIHYMVECVIRLSFVFATIAAATNHLATENQNLVSFLALTA